MTSRSTNRVHLTWIGTTENELGWLHRQFEHTETIELNTRKTFDATDLLAEIENSEDSTLDRRMLFACDTRVSYPLKEISYLLQSLPEIPLAVATGAWWHGARRTGIGATNHLTLPWHRWWDGWHGWIQGSTSELYGPLVKPTAFAMPQYSPSAATSLESEQRPAPEQSSLSGWIIADCGKTATAWIQSANQAGMKAKWKRSRDLFEQHTESIATNLAAPYWILLDDSCFSTSGGETEWKTLRSIEESRKHFPRETQWAAALTLPKWETWSALEQIGFNGLISKPNTGVSLCNWLQQQDFQLRNQCTN